VAWTNTPFFTGRAREPQNRCFGALGLGRLPDYDNGSDLPTTNHHLQVGWRLGSCPCMPILAVSSLLVYYVARLILLLYSSSRFHPPARRDLVSKKWLNPDLTDSNLRKFVLKVLTTSSGAVILTSPLIFWKFRCENFGRNRWDQWQNRRWLGRIVWVLLWITSDISNLQWVDQRYTPRLTTQETGTLFYQR
jgi:hypothetical protein